MNRWIQALVNGQTLDYDASHDLFSRIVEGELSEIEITSALVALKLRGEQAREIAGAAAALRDSAMAFPTDCRDAADNCGTGGDGLHTINISTAAAVVAAAAGVPMVKHGNRSVSSRCGSADVLEALGINIQADPSASSRCLEERGICFLFALSYHPGIRHVMPVRRALKTRTIFNLLGPLVNPARPGFQLLGVFDPHNGPQMAQALHKLGTRRALVVHGGGMDELALDCPNQCWLLSENGTVEELTINAQDHGLSAYPRDAIKGDDPQANRDTLTALFSGRGANAHRQVVALNAGAVIWIAGHSENLNQGISRALEVLESDQCARLVHDWAEVSHAG